MTERWNAEATTVAPETAPALTQAEIDRRVFELYDEYCHGRIDRREFLQRASLLTVGGLAMAQALLPRYALAQTISFTDQRIKARYVTYPSPGGNSGTMRGYLVQPSGSGPFPAVLVIHENRGLNPYIEDVARRVATEGFLALAPDGLSPVGGYPGNDDDGRTLQAGLDQTKLRTDMVNGARFVKAHALSTGKLGVTGFCWGGSTTNFLATELGTDLGAAVPFYGAAAETARGTADQGAAADPVRRERRAHQRAVAGVRGGAEGQPASATRCTCTPARSTASTTTRRRATTRRRPSWPGSGRSPSSRRTWPEDTPIMIRPHARGPGRSRLDRDAPRRHQLRQLHPRHQGPGHRRVTRRGDRPDAGAGSPARRAGRDRRLRQRRHHGRCRADRRLGHRVPRLRSQARGADELHRGVPRDRGHLPRAERLAAAHGGGGRPRGACAWPRRPAPTTSCS